MESERGCLLLVQKEKTTEGFVESQGGALREVVLGGFSCRGAGLQLIQQPDNRVLVCPHETPWLLSKLLLLYLACWRWLAAMLHLAQARWHLL